MRSRHRHRLFVGLGALLGLWSAGCQSGSSANLTAPNVMGARTGSGVVLMNPRVLAGKDATPRPVFTAKAPASFTAGAHAASPVRAQPVASAPSSNGGVVVASSWRPQQRDDGSVVVLGDPPMKTADGTPPEKLDFPPAPVGGPVTDGMVVSQAPPEGTCCGSGSGKVSLFGGGRHGGGGVVAAGIDAPREWNKIALQGHVIEPSDVLFLSLQYSGPVPQPIYGYHPVASDGFISLGIYGRVPVAGQTLGQARDTIAAFLTDPNNPNALKNLKVKVGEKEEVVRVADLLYVDLAQNNTKAYYIIADGAGYGAQVVRRPIQGYETVLDALSEIGGLPSVASKKKIWVARPNPHYPGGHRILPVDYNGIVQRGSATTNYQLMPGDRLYVHSDGLQTTNNVLGKILNIPDRALGSVLLGSTVVNSISGRGVGGNR